MRLQVIPKYTALILVTKLQVSFNQLVFLITRSHITKISNIKRKL